MLSIDELKRRAVWCKPSWRTDRSRYLKWRKARIALGMPVREGGGQEALIRARQKGRAK